MKSVRFLPLFLAARSIRLRSSGLMRMFSVSRLLEVSLSAGIGDLLSLVDHKSMRLHCHYVCLFLGRWPLDLVPDLAAIDRPFLPFEALAAWVQLRFRSLLDCRNA